MHISSTAGEEREIEIETERGRLREIEIANDRENLGIRERERF